MTVLGDIYFHQELQFSDGSTGEKLIVLLNTPSKYEPFLFLKVTSQKKNKPATPGCLPKYAAFFIPQGKSFFKTDTWVQLYEIYEISQKDIKTEPHITHMGTLDIKTTNALIKCLLDTQADDISQYHRALICPQLQDSMNKLIDYFNKNRC